MNEEEEIEIYELQYHKEKNYKIIINFEHNFYFLILTKKKKNFISKRKKNEETFLNFDDFFKIEKKIFKIIKKYWNCKKKLKIPKKEKLKNFFW